MVRRVEGIDAAYWPMPGIVRMITIAYKCVGRESELAAPL
jgi:hypothetical protein